MWYTDLTDFDNKTPAVLASLKRYFSNATGSLIFLIPQANGQIAYNQDTMRIFIDAGVHPQNIIPIANHADIENLQLEFVDTSTGRRTVVKRKVGHAEAVIRRSRLVTDVTP